MQKVGRNDPCPCGSGKKYKSCHMDREEHKQSNNKSVMYVLIFVAIILVGLTAAYYNNQNDTAKAATPEKVWSEEHQHYH